MLTTILLVIAGIVLVAGGVWAAMALRDRLVGEGTGAAGGSADTAAVLQAVGPARCVAALALFKRLAGRRDAAGLVRAIEIVEIPLLQAIPDCPPSLKPALGEALSAAAEICTNRDAAKRLITLRNSVIGGRVPGSR